MILSTMIDVFAANLLIDHKQIVALLRTKEMNLNCLKVQI